jgi:DNA-binding NarL/FixJ family response regulator
LQAGAGSVRTGATATPSGAPGRGGAATRTILIVDDDPSDRARLRAAIARAGYATAEAATGEQALELTDEITPALVIVDICLPGISGYEVCHALHKRFGDALPIVFVSAMRTKSYDRVAGLLLGADAYFTKPVAPDELLIHVRRLMARASPISPGVARALTTREQEVLGLMAAGLRPSEIADQLVLSQKTVGTHIEHIFAKLGVRSRAQAVAAAYRNELVGTGA